MNKRIIAFIMALVLCVVPLTVMATDTGDNIISPRWTYVYSITVTLTPNGYIGGAVELESFYDFMLTLQLQENDGTGWTTIETWTEEGNLVGSIEDYCDLDPDCEYRAKVIAQVYNDFGSLVERVQLYSDVV